MEKRVASSCRRKRFFNKSFGAFRIARQKQVTSATGVTRAGGHGATMRVG